MKHFLSGLIFLFLFIQCRHQPNYEGIIQGIEHQFVPDKRTGIFSVHADAKSSKIILKGETDNKDAHLALIKKLKEAGYSVEDNMIDLPYKNTQPWGLISLSVANMRISPSHDAEMVTQALMGTPVRILKEEDDWVLVQTPDNYLSWCEKDAIQFCSEESIRQWKNSDRVLITEWTCFLRDSVTNKIVSDLVAGCILELSSKTKTDVVLTTPDGRKGKLSLKYIEDFNSWKAHKTISREDVKTTSGNFMGSPYLWGGASVKAADCSGFVKMVYFLNGYVIPRDASQQALYGKEISISRDHNFLTGDLLFFGRRADGEKPERITHVGMYLGNSEFIHSSGRVRVNSFDSTKANYSRYRTISLLKVRRIIGHADLKGITQVKNHPWY